MNISALFIKRPVMTMLVMISILMFGILSYRSLPVSDLPNIEYPTITVNASQPGGNPQYMADTISMPLERNLANISGLNTMSSTNTTGSTSIVLNFNLDVNIDEKQVEVESALRKSSTDLPPMPTPPTFQKTNPSESPILFVRLTSQTEDPSLLYEYAYNVLAQPLSMIQGISQVQVYGYPYAVRVQVDPMKLQQYQIDLNTISEVLIRSTPNLPSGKMRGTHNNLLLDTDGQLYSAEEYNQVILKQNNNTPLRVADLGGAINSFDGQRDPHVHYVSKDEVQNSVVLAISRLSDSNTLSISDAVLKKLPELQKNLPASIEMSIFYDKASTILNSVEDVKLTLLIAFILVVIVIYFYLGKIIETLIPTAVLPMSLIGTFILMYFWKFNIDNLSLLAMTIAIGFVVDDAIVVLENIVRHFEMGKTRMQAALDGSAEINLTVVSMTLSLAAVFIPMVWMPGMLGRIFNEFSVTLIFTILVSGFISLTLNPMLCSLLLRPKSQSLSIFEKIHEKMLQCYQFLLRKALNMKKTVVAFGVICFVLSFLLLKILPADFLPPTNSEILQGLTLAQEGSSMKNTSSHQNEIEQVLMHHPFIRYFISACGISTDDQGFLYLNLVPYSKRPPAYVIAWQLMSQLSEIVGIQVFLKPLPLINLQVGTGTSLGDYQFILTSQDEKKLYESAPPFIEKMQKMPELVGVNTDLKIRAPQLNIRILRDQAYTYNISAEQIERTLQYAFSQGRIATFTRGSNLYNLILEVLPDFEFQEKDLNLLYITSSSGEQVPLSSLVDIEYTTAPSTVNHTNLFPSVTVSFNLAESAALGPVINKLNDMAQEMLPVDVTATIEGSGKVFLETFKAMGFLIFVAVFVIFVILGILYEGVLHPFIILSDLPLAIFGGLVTLWIFKEPLSLYSVVGMIVLIGLVQKNGIMMVDFALEHLKQENSDPTTAIFEACSQRFRPIMMTTLTTIVAAIPVALGIGANGDINRPLGLVLVGGLLFSQTMTLFFTPVVFVYMENFERYLTKKREEKKIRKGPGEISN